MGFLQILSYGTCGGKLVMIKGLCIQAFFLHTHTLNSKDIGPPKSHKLTIQLGFAVKRNDRFVD